MQTGWKWGVVFWAAVACMGATCAAVNVEPLAGVRIPLLRRFRQVGFSAQVVPPRMPCAAPLVTLTVTEREGTARAGEMVVTGVPLPQGRVKDAAALGLYDAAGAALRAEVRPVNRWPDGSIRWVHLYFPADCPAAGTRQVHLAAGAAARAAPPLLAVDDTPEAITVTTGPLKFVVRKRGFNLIDAAWIDETGQGRFDAAHQIIAPHTQGAVVRAGGQAYSAVNDREVAVRVEELGPMHVVIRAAGAHRNPAGEKHLDFVARLYAYAGSPAVKLVYTFINAQGADRQVPMRVEAIHLDLPTTVRGGRATFGAEAQAPAADLDDDAEAFVFASDSDTITWGGAVSGSAKGKSAKPVRPGWADLSDGAKGLAAGVRWFWQMHPKSVETSGAGRVRIGLIPARHRSPVDVYIGVARTHEMLLVFHQGAADVRRLEGRFAALRQPLRAWAPPRWFCRDTQAFGQLVESDPDLYRDEYRAAAEHYDRIFRQNYDQFTRWMDGRKAGGHVRDDYGLFEWGDNFHYTKVRPDGSLNYEFNGNYYGYDHMMCLQWARTAFAGYFDHFETHALHVADVHTVHWDHDTRAGIPNFWIGGNRYCPPGDHVRNDDPPRYSVYISPFFSHHKAQGLFERWYLLADHRMLDVLEEIGGLVMRFKDNDYSESSPRGPAHLMLTLMEFWQVTGDRKYLDRLNEVFGKNEGKPHTKGQRHFMSGLLAEAVARYHALTGNPKAPAFIEDFVTRFTEPNRPEGNMAYAAAYLAHLTGDRAYLDFAARCVRTMALTGKEKDFALSMRNGMQALTYMAKEPPPDEARE